MASPLTLVAGLGNPGTRYDPTRHNAGFWFVDELARLHGGTFRSESRFSGDLATINIGGRKLVLLKPTTFMNRSGQSVAAVARYYKFPAEQVCIVHDELDLDAGTVRFKTGGGAGGHNGIKDVISHFSGNKNFHRLRLGIGHPGDRGKVLEYVLKAPSVDDRRAIEDGVDLSLRVFDDLARGEFMLAMNVLHQRPANQSAHSSKA